MYIEYLPVWKFSVYKDFDPSPAEDKVGVVS